MLNTVGQIQIGKWGEQANQVSRRYYHSCLLLLTEILHILLERIRIARIRRSELPSEDVVVPVQPLLQVHSVGNIENGILKLDWFLVDAEEVDFYLELLVSGEKATPEGL